MVYWRPVCLLCLPVIFVCCYVCSCTLSRMSVMSACYLCLLLYLTRAPSRMFVVPSVCTVTYVCCVYRVHRHVCLLCLTCAPSHMLVMSVHVHCHVRLLCPPVIFVCCDVCPCTPSRTFVMSIVFTVTYVC